MHSVLDRLLAPPAAKPPATLIQAATLGDLQAARRFLSGGKPRGGKPKNPVTQRDLDTSLVAAAAEGHTEVVGLLLDAGARLAVDRHRALRRAAAAGRAATVGLLLERGAKANVLDNSPICEASRAGHAEVVRLLIAAGADVAAQGNYPIGWAAGEGRHGVVAVLLAHGADAWTPVAERRYDVDLKAYVPMSARQIADRCGYLDVVAVIDAYAAQQRLMAEAAAPSRQTEPASVASLGASLGALPHQGL